MIYIDGLSSWPMRPEAQDILVDALAQYGNSNSNHIAGWRASRLYETGRRSVASLVGAAPEEIYITSGATESNALAIIGTARASVFRNETRNKIKLRNVIVIHDLKKQGLSVSAIARQTGLDRKTVRKYLAVNIWIGALRHPFIAPVGLRPQLRDPYKA